MLTASKKVITWKWMSNKPPTLEEWIELIQDVAQMEKLTFALRIDHDKFEECWKPWKDFINTLK